MEALRNGGKVRTVRRMARYVEPQITYTAVRASQIRVGVASAR